MQILSWSRCHAVMREWQVGLTLLAGGIALLVSLSMSQYLNRDLLAEFGAASRLLDRQQTIAAGHESALDGLLALSRSLSAEGNGPDALNRAARELRSFSHRLGVMAERLDTVPGFATHGPVRQAVVALQAYAASADAVLSAPGERGAVLQALRPATLDAMDTLVRLGRELRTHDVAERMGQQRSMSTLRTRTLALTYLMCLMFSVTVAMATHWVLLARREARMRREIDAARRDAEAASERAEAAARDKSKFLGMLSHELLTPLQSIISSMDIIESRGQVDAGEPIFLRLREGTRALRARMSDLVDFAKMSAGRLAVSPRKFRLDRLVEDVIADHEEAVVRKDLDVHWEPGPGLAQPVVTDPRRVRQILDNLVSNAIKYTQRGGVTVQAEVDPERGELRFEVRDTGVGIAPEALAHVFDPFYRVASSTELAEGSGLGLAVVRSLVDLLDGRIEVESVPGEGTRVSVWLPAGQPSAPTQGPEVPSPPIGERPVVLIVDDAHDVRAAVAEVVRSLGYQSAEAGSAREALRSLGERRFAAVLLDIELPDLPGHEIARRLREGDGPNRQTHLVMLSASNTVDAEALRLFDARADKPVEARQLQAALQPALGHAGGRVAPA
jgi:signal transduction histidine kinase/CheY-like chemotaxis protein